MTITNPNNPPPRLELEHLPPEQVYEALKQATARLRRALNTSVEAAPPGGAPLSRSERLLLAGLIDAYLVGFQQGERQPGNAHDVVDALFDLHLRLVARPRYDQGWRSVNSAE